jgi:precorrin-3B synthase
VSASPARDSCPGVLALHPARDGFVARIRLPGGYVSRSQWAALGALASDFGDGCLDVTARGNVQLRGLQQAAAAGLAGRAHRAGLLPSSSHDRSRNITASPLSGLGGRPPLRRLVSALDAALVADPVLAALPGRFLFALDDGTGGAQLAASDIGLRREGRHADLVIAGRLAGVRLPCSAAVPAMLTAARAAVSAGAGTLMNRIRDLAGGGAAIATAIGGSPGARVAAQDSRLPLGICAQDSSVLIAAAPLGRLNAQQLALIGAMSRTREVIRLTAAGRVVIPLAGKPAAALDVLAGAGLLTDDRDDLAGVTACSGTACRRAVADVRAVARALPGHPRTHWAACPRRCGQPRDAEAVVATGPDSFLVPGQSAPRSAALLAGES